MRIMLKQREYLYVWSIAYIIMYPGLCVQFANVWLFAEALVQACIVLKIYKYNIS